MSNKTNTELATAGLTSDDQTVPRTAIKKIVVIESGWVVIGYVERQGDLMVIYEGNVIRSWGTTMGLGEIALDGPTKDIVLDPCGYTEVPFHAVIMQIRCVV